MVRASLNSRGADRPCAPPCAPGLPKRCAPDAPPRFGSTMRCAPLRPSALQSAPPCMRPVRPGCGHATPGTRTHRDRAPSHAALKRRALRGRLLGRAWVEGVVLQALAMPLSIRVCGWLQTGCKRAITRYRVIREAQ